MTPAVYARFMIESVYIDVYYEPLFKLGSFRQHSLQQFVRDSAKTLEV